MAAPIDNKGLDLAPDAGSLTASTKFAVQQSSSPGLIQRILRSAMVVTGQITGQGFLDEVRAMTPASFQATVATETTKGTAQYAPDADIASQSGDGVLRSGKITETFESGIAQGGTIEQSDVDTGSTQGTVTVVSIRQIVAGKMRVLSGQFTYVSNSNAEKKSLYFNNTKVPIQYTAIGAQVERSDVSGLKLPITIGIESAGTDRIRMDINTQQAGLNWDTSYTYTIDFTIPYLIP